MGNYMSCSYLHPKLKSPKPARVVFPSGEIRWFRNPTNAAEVMLECPGHFLVNKNSLNIIGRRFSPLLADEVLEIESLYVMIPMRRVNSVVTAADAAGFSVSADSTVDIEGRDYERSRLSLNDEFEYNKRRLSVCRSRKPDLDTIVEECVFSR